MLKEENYEEARRKFRWPSVRNFNWALDYFDSRDAGRPALVWINDELLDSKDKKVFTYGKLRALSNSMANGLRELGLGRGDVIMVMMGNKPELFISFLAIMKIGGTISPATTLLTPSDVEDRTKRANIKAIIADSTVADRVDSVRDRLTTVKAFISTEARRGWLDLGDVYEGKPENYRPDFTTDAIHDPLLLYFTSGTTAKPKIARHTYASYPVGHLTTMYWTGTRPGYLHYNISSPGWAKWAWSTFFAPLNAEAASFVYEQGKFNAARQLMAVDEYEVNTICAPPTVWRMVLLEDLSKYDFSSLKGATSAGEPLNPEVIERVRRGAGITIRDGYGQTETTLLIGNFPGMMVKPGSMGKPAPGYDIVLVDEDGAQARPGVDGHITVKMEPRPIGVMTGYHDDNKRNEEVFRLGLYWTGDVAFMDGDGYFFFVGRADDVFKSSDYRVSPFEVESELLKHPAVAESAVVPSPDPLKGSLPKAFIILRPGYSPSRELARDIFLFSKKNIAPYKRPRIIEFVDELPKTISGKIRRVELRSIERKRREEGARGNWEFFESDFPDVRDMRV
ncbi:AMP-binding protein [Thermocladium modestius]|uniref:AMP-binding protein n=1 Tax=Thermocladium modestius TaxID=62609 RepID=A0A830GR18_9CREN|nr:AMP-binding protein [Thermocladium modestius]